MVLYVKSMALLKKWDENEEKDGIGKTLDFDLSKRIDDDLENSGQIWGTEAKFACAK